MHPPWKLDTTLLADKEFCKLIPEKIDDFLKLNKSDGASPSLLWETLKALL